MQAGGGEADGWEGWDEGPADSLLLERLEQAQRLVRGGRLLAKHGIAASVAELRDSDRQTATLLLRQLLASVAANVGITDSRQAPSPEPLTLRGINVPDQYHPPDPVLACIKPTEGSGRRSLDAQDLGLKDEPVWLQPNASVNR